MQEVFPSYDIILYCWEPSTFAHMHIWGLWRQTQVSQAGISIYIPLNTMGCNYLSLPEIPASHYNGVIMSMMASQITSLMIVYSTVSSSVDQRKHQSSASLAFVQRIYWWPVNSPHKGPVTRKIFHLMTSSCDTKVLISPWAICLFTASSHKI